MIAELLDRIALWWLDRRTAPPSGLIRFIGGPLDGETHDVGNSTPLHATVHLHHQAYHYRADGTTDTDGAMRLHHDPEGDDQ